MNVRVGDEAPRFTLLDQRGEPWALQDHLPAVVYFYPKDETRGCTEQACDVRDHWAEFRALGVAVAGISPDDVDSHSRFAAKHGLPHTLLADPQRQVIDAYGAWGEKQRRGETVVGVIRSSAVIDANGRVAAVFDTIMPAEQSAKALAVARDLA